MTNESKDDRFDGWLKEAARDYNRPPAAVPRDEMWEVIAAATTTASGTTTTSDAGRVPSATGRSGVSRRQVWGMAAAASLLLGAGFGLGQLYKSDGGATRTPSVATAPAMAGNATYQVATLRHLTDAEAMLTSFQNAAASPDAQMDATVQNWARELLTNTRLLLDSPASDDTQRKQLLTDLELILVQIVQLHSGNAASDRAIIDGTIDRDQVMTRIRTAIPAGATSGP